MNNLKQLLDFECLYGFRIYRWLMGGTWYYRIGGVNLPMSDTYWWDRDGSKNYLSWPIKTETWV